MFSIHKYLLEIEDRQEISMPEGARIIKVGLDTKSQPCIWAIVNTFHKTTDRIICIYATGQVNMDIDFDDYVGSFNLLDCTWHVFE